MFGLYKHYKGGYYFVLGIGSSSEDREQKSVIYYSLSKWCFWLRPLGMFRSAVEYDNKIVPRFKKVIGL